MARRGVGLAIGAATGVLFLGLAPAAFAQVLSIGDDGAVTTYSTPQIFTTEGVRPVAPPVDATVSRATPAEVAVAIQDASARHAVPAPLIEAVAWQESRFNQA